MLRVLIAAILSGVSYAQEITIDQIVKAVAQVETGVRWIDTGRIVGRWSVGDAGEVSPWQLSPGLLQDLGKLDARWRIHRDPVLAESLFRLSFTHLLGRTGSYVRALAAYHRGLHGAGGQEAQDYARRVLNLVESYQ